LLIDDQTTRGIVFIHFDISPNPAKLWSVTNRYNHGDVRRSIR
jgi:hypothetical protein